MACAASYSSALPLDGESLHSFDLDHLQEPPCHLHQDFQSFSPSFLSPLQRLAHNVWKLPQKSIILQSYIQIFATKMEQMLLFSKNIANETFIGDFQTLWHRWVNIWRIPRKKRTLKDSCFSAQFPILPLKAKRAPKGECKIRNCYDFQDINFLCCLRLELLKIVVINVRLKIEIWQMH